MTSVERVRQLLTGPQPLLRLGSLALIALGWLLSPLCWWNDLLFNLPLALGFAKLVQWLEPAWFVPALVAGYWISNVLGIVLMQSGALGLLGNPNRADRRRELLVGLATSSAYTLGVLLLVKLGWLQAPLDLLDGLGGAHGLLASAG